MHALNRFAIAAVLAMLALAGAATPAAAVNCGNLNATAIDFGVYNPHRVSATLSQGTVSVRCTGLGKIKGKSLRVTLEAGSSGNCADRHMTSGQGVLRYNLYRDAARTQPVGRASHGCVDLFGPARAPKGDFDLRLTIYGLVPPGQALAAGTYADTIHLVIEFFD